MPEVLCESDCASRFEQGRRPGVSGSSEPQTTAVVRSAWSTMNWRRTAAVPAIVSVRHSAVHAIRPVAQGTAVACQGHWRFHLRETNQQHSWGAVIKHSGIV
jgi:hypothetical protein